MTNKNNNQINASPTKVFFIDMLVKDIPLIDAIADLVDNSVDAATKLRRDKDLTNLKVEIKFDKSSFSITDNCGGFNTDVARTYAFRFGRPEEVPEIPNSIGRFGVGMKRALFKLGNNIHISSKTTNSYFEVDLDLNKWKSEENNWTWEFNTINEEEQEGEFGTTISVHNLYDQVANTLSEDSFTDQLIKMIRVSHEKVLEKGLVIIINGIELSFTPSSLYISDDIRPAYFTKTISGVDIEVIVGVTEPGNPREAGWYIYCNGRLVVAANRTQLTGWGDGHPLYHPQYAMFRGYVYFESDNPSLLPWNTTKNGIDEESNIFKAIRPLMIDMMKPVTTFLRKLRAESFEGEENIVNEEYEADKSLYDYVMEIKPKTISSIDKSLLVNRFRSPVIKVVRKPNTQKIQYNMPVEMIEKAKEALPASTLREVGEKTFEYFYRMECR